MMDDLTTNTIMERMKEGHTLRTICIELKIPYRIAYDVVKQHAPELIRPIRFTKEETADLSKRAAQLYESGMSIQAVSDELYIPNLMTVHRWLKAAGVKTRSRGHPLVECKIDLELLRTEYVDNMLSTTDIVDKYSESYSTVSEVYNDLKKFGVPLRSRSLAPRKSKNSLIRNELLPSTVDYWRSQIGSSVKKSEECSVEE